MCSELLSLYNHTSTIDDITNNDIQIQNKCKLIQLLRESAQGKNLYHSQHIESLLSQASNMICSYGLLLCFFVGLCKKFPNLQRLQVFK